MKGSNITLQKFTGAPEQQFQVFTDYIICGCSGLSLDIKGGVGEGKEVIQWDFNGQSNQKFNFTRDGTVTVAGLNVVARSVNENQPLFITRPNTRDKGQIWRVVTRK